MWTGDDELAAIILLLSSVRKNVCFHPSQYHLRMYIRGQSENNIHTSQPGIKCKDLERKLGISFKKKIVKEMGTEVNCITVSKSQHNYAGLSGPIHNIPAKHKMLK